jgi:hypothetical protein
MTQVVAIEQKGVPAELMEALFDQVGDRAFSRSAQTGKPQQGASVAVAFRSPFSADSLGVPDNLRCSWVGSHGDPKLFAKEPPRSA